METKKQYFSFVSDRINKLKEELEKNELELAQLPRIDKRKIITYQLKIRFLKHKISYLEKIKDLPFYIVISELSSEQLREIRNSIGKLGLSLEETRAYLMEKLKLHDIPSLIKHSDISYLSEIKDYETIIRLSILQKRNGNYKQQKRDLQRELEIPIELCYPALYQVFEQPGKTKPLCYHEIDFVKKRVAIYENKLKQIIDVFEHDYKEHIIGETFFYLKHLEEYELSSSFIETHREKVIAHFPEQKSSIKYLLHSRKKMRILKKFDSKKRRKKDQEFLNCVIACYQKDEIFSFFEIDEIDLFSLSKKEFHDITFKIEKKIRSKKEKIKILNQNIWEKENEILNTAKDYNLLQENAKTRFSEIINSSIADFQDSWLHWLWQVPDFLGVFMKGHTLAEVEVLVECLKNPFPYYEEEELVKQIVYTLKQTK